METFGFYKTIKTGSRKPKNAFSKLHNLYNNIPDTVGCMDNIAKEGGCGGWCCECQSPQLLYSEFLNLWNSVMRDWDVEQICDVIEKSLQNYVMGSTTKGCVFFDKNTKMCRVHKKRPYNCRIYGITPEEEFKPRLERMKAVYKDVADAIIKDQCHLIKTADGKEVTTEDTDKWWMKLVEIERGIGIPKENVNDDMGGSYRTPHDHVLLYMLPDFIMQKLQEIRFIDNQIEKMEIVSKYMDAVRRSMIKDE
jgi:Fe-S-cluster containining protein